ncbi:unnamed protein product [Rotaria sp. Silwood1]|nr:unnamed protein product [Rotaria sp. Silwood1]
MTVRLWLKEWYKIMIIIIAPILLLPLPLLLQTDCAYAVLLLLIYWISEAIPVPVTSLLPLVLFPLLGILKASEVTSNYFKDTAAFFFGSVTLAYAIQTVNLHRRVALFVLKLVGSSAKCFQILNKDKIIVKLKIMLALVSFRTNERSVEITNISMPSSEEEKSAEQEEKSSSEEVIKLRKG